MATDDPGTPFPGPADIFRARTGRRLAIIKGQDKSRWTDVYHAVLTAPWGGLIAALSIYTLLINVVFAALYMCDPGGLAGARPGHFEDYFLFSIETLGSINYSTIVPRSIYANVVVVGEAFFGLLNLALITGICFARFSRPFARVLFSEVAVVTPFDGVPTLMLRAANQRGNQILDAAISLSFARQTVTREGLAMRRFEELKLVRARSPLFALSWTIMHRIDEDSPLFGATRESLEAGQAEIIALLSGTDDTLAETIYARQSYRAGQILWNRRFADVLSVDAAGRRVVDLTRFHDTDDAAVISAPSPSFRPR
jgi:inward rectifier potassium channel